MRIVMMGTGPFAAPTFLRLLDSDHEIPQLVTRPPHAPRGRRPPPVSPMVKIAQAHGVPIAMPEDINTAAAQADLAAQRPDLLVVCDYGQILSRGSLAIAPLGGINLHGSLLPKYRGAAPINWALYHGEQETGVTVIHMTPQLDGGPAISVRRLAIGPEETAGEIEPRMAELGVEAVMESIERLERWRQSPAETLGELQDQSLATNAPRLQKKDGLVDWSRTARQIHQQVRAFQPWPGTYTHWQRESGEPIRMILERVSVVDGTEADAGDGGPALPGTVVSTEAGRLLVATGRGLLSVDQLQPAGKRAMSSTDFLRGAPLRPGDRFA